MARRCNIITAPTDIVLKTAANTVETVQGISKEDVTMVLHGRHGEHMTMRCRVVVNKHETEEVMLGQEVLQVAGCDISLSDECLYFRPYASIGSYHKAVILFVKSDTTLGEASCNIISAQAVMA